MRKNWWLVPNAHITMFYIIMLSKHVIMYIYVKKSAYDIKLGEIRNPYRFTYTAWLKLPVYVRQTCRLLLENNLTPGGQDMTRQTQNLNGLWLRKTDMSDKSWQAYSGQSEQVFCFDQYRTCIILPYKATTYDSVNSILLVWQYHLTLRWDWLEKLSNTDAFVKHTDSNSKDLEDNKHM